MYILVTGGLGFIGSRVVIQLVKRGIPTIVADINSEKNKIKLEKNLNKITKDTSLFKFEELDITNFENIENIFRSNKIDSVINLAYGIGTICENNPLLASKINIVGTTSIFEMIIKYKIRRLVFASSETVYGAYQSFFGKKAIKEDDFSTFENQHYTYGVMKILNEFMAEKYIKKHGCSIAYTRPSVVFGYGRQNTAINWAEDFAAKPALGEPASGVLTNCTGTANGLTAGVATTVTITDNESTNEIRSIMGGETHKLKWNRKLVDTSFLTSPVPSVNPPSFHVEDTPEIKFCPVNGIAKIHGGNNLLKKFMIIGAGKTSMDAIVFLLNHGVDPDSISWIRPRETWLFYRDDDGKNGIGGVRGFGEGNIGIFADSTKTVDDFF